MRRDATRRSYHARGAQRVDSRRVIAQFAQNAVGVLAERGREYFVQATATLMEALQLDHDQVQALFATEVTQLQQANAAASDKKRYLASLMQPCQLSLEASGL